MDHQAFFDHVLGYLWRAEVVLEPGGSIVVDVPGVDRLVDPEALGVGGQGSAEVDVDVLFDERVEVVVVFICFKVDMEALFSEQVKCFRMSDCPSEKLYPVVV